MINKKFGKLTVIKKTDLRDACRRIIWKCQCECGNERLVDTSSLTSGKVQACKECTKKISQTKRKETLSTKPIKNDLTGRVFNRLTVLYPTDKRDANRCIIWRCKCVCGKECDVSTKDLTSQNVKSCGCLNTETRKSLGQANKKDLTGQKFGKLLVLEDSGQRKDNNILWKCQCDCGNQPLIKGTSLLHGVKSCGCLKSKGEARIAELLSQNNIKFETQKTFKDCIFPDTNYHAYFDFWIDDKYLIEYDGIQHFESSLNSNNWNTEANLLETQKRDKYKNNWCKKNNIPLIRISYTQLKTLCIEDLLLKG